MQPPSSSHGGIARSHPAQQHVIRGMDQVALVVEILVVEDIHVPDQGGEGQKEGVQAVKEPAVPRKDRRGILNSREVTFSYLMQL